MKIIVTGKTGVGKTTILKNSNFKQILFADELVKEKFYVKGHEVFNKVVTLFGDGIVSVDKIDTKKLGTFVLSDQLKLHQLSLLVIPFVKDYINNLDGNWIIEMAGFINYQKEFKDVFDKIILVERDSNLVENKFKNSKGEVIQLIEETPVNADFIIKNNSSIANATSQLNDFLLSIGFESI